MNYEKGISIKDLFIINDDDFAIKENKSELL